MLLFLLACADLLAPAPQQPPSRDQTRPPRQTPKGAEDARTRATEAADELGKTLKTTLVGTMKAQGPLAAVTVCQQSAGSLTAGVATKTGTTVGRSSLRLRNASNAAPDWVQTWLDEQGERKAAGVKASVSVKHDRQEGRWVGRVIRPLAVGEPCLKCHGGPGDLAPGIADFLADKYPDDKATGYALGDLRGALYAEAIIEDDP